VGVGLGVRKEQRSRRGAGGCAVGRGVVAVVAGLTGLCALCDLQAFERFTQGIAESSSGSNRSVLRRKLANCPGSRVHL